MLLICYTPNGERGRCGRGCCGPSETWSSELIILEVASEAEALALIFDPTNELVHRTADTEFRLVTASYAGDPDWVTVLNNTPEFDKKINEQAQALAAEEAANKAKLAKEQQEYTERQDKQTLERLLAKYPQGKSGQGET